MENIEEIPTPNVINFGQLIKEDFPLYWQIHIVPNNEDEIFYQKLYLLDTIINDTLWKTIHYGAFIYNMESKEERLVTRVKMEKPDYGKKDWIIFSYSNGSTKNIWKIKSNGDSLTQLTFYGAAVYGGAVDPVWNADGTRFIHNFYWYNYTIVADEFGHVLDTVQLNQTYHSWNSDSSVVVYDRHESLGIQNVYTGEYRLIVDGSYTSPQVNGRSPYINDCHWLDSDHIIWKIAFEGMYITNVNSKETIKLFDSRKSRYYPWFTYAPTKKKLFFVRNDARLLDTVHYKEVQRSWHIVMMNLDGTGEQVLDIPETK